jgi:broad specificity phosphatase PhoE
MLLTIVRHGESSDQIDAVHANNPNSSLSERGRAQAKLTGLRMARLHPTHIISSPLRRALETAYEISLACGFDVVEVWEDLREGFETTFLDDERKTGLTCCPHAKSEIWSSDGYWTNLGDTRDTFFARRDAVFQRLATEFPDNSHNVVVTHGAFANWLVHRLLDIPRRERSAVWFHLDNCSLTQFETGSRLSTDWRVWWLYPSIGLKVLRLNDTSHLAALCRCNET